MFKILPLILFVFASLSPAYGCHIESYKKIFKINKVLDSSVIKSSDCDERAKKVFVKFLSSARGKMKPDHLSQMFKSEFDLNVTFASEIEVLELKEFLLEKLDLKDAVITSLSSLYGKASLNLEGAEAMGVDCSSCSEPGDRNIKLVVGGKTIWFSSTLKVRRKGYKLTQDISPFTSHLRASLLEPVHTVANGRDLFFQDLENLHFYRANKPLLKGSVLKQKDLSPKNLVKYNHEVEVWLKGENISLKTSAKARQNGKFGERIKLYNAKTKKVILGKVIDFNKVLVEL